MPSIEAELQNALTVRSRKAKLLSSQDLIHAPCLKANQKDACTSQEIIGDLYKAMMTAE